MSTHLFLSTLWESLASLPWQLYAALAAGLGCAALVAGLLLRACSYRLILHLGDGKTVCERHAGDCKLELLPLPPREGYRFVGWFADEGCTEPVVGVFRVPRRGAELYARWKVDLPRGARELRPPLRAARLAEGDAALASTPAFRGNAAPVAVPCAVASDMSAAPPPLASAASEREFAAVSSSDAAPSSADTPSPAAAPAVARLTVPSLDAASARAAAPSPAVVSVRGAARPDAPRSATFIPAPPFAAPSPESAAEEEGEFSRALLTSAEGEMIFLRLRRSFLARIALADQSVQALFASVRSALLALRGVRERVAWGGASYSCGRVLLARVVANAKSLAVCLAVDPQDAACAGVHFRDVSDRKRFAAVPVRCKVTGERSLRAVLMLVRRIAERRGLQGGATAEPFAFPPADRAKLTARGLIRVSACRANGEKVAEGELRALLAAGATLETFSAAFALRRASRRAARFLLGEAPRAEVRSQAARALVNLDTLSANYAAGERVDICSLREKGLVDRRATACKVLARGGLDKPLTIEAEEFSLAAERMIAQTGGKAVRPARGK